MQVNHQETKTGFVRSAEAPETKGEKPVSSRIGIAEGKLKCPDDLDLYNDEVALLFGQSE